MAEEDFVNLFGFSAIPELANQTLKIDHEKAEIIRSYLTERLAKVGFDEDYELTLEGRILEDLIDHLYMPNITG